MQRNSEPQTSRKLAAVLAADVVGFSRMIAADEAAPVCALHSLLAEVFRPIFANNNGDIVKSMGDGWLVELASSVAAVNAAMQIQDRLKEDPTISLHVGVHIGDVTRNEHDLYEDGINVAAGLEAITPEGGVMISDAVYSGLGGTLSPSFEAAGAQNLKNIARPVTTWVRARNGLVGHADASEHEITSNLPVLNIRPTANSDPRAELQDTADALTANLATYFGSINWLQTSISSSENAMGYSLRPILRARGDRLRLETRLQDPGGDIIWTHKSDSRLGDVFDWQDNVVADIADLGLGIIFEAETTKLMATPDEKLTAEQCMLMGIMTWRDLSGESFVRSAEFHDHDITAKPDLADALAEALMVVMAARTMGSNPGMDAFLFKVPAWVEAGRPLAAGHAILTLSIAIATYVQDQQPIPLKHAVAQTLRLAPFDARILTFCGWANLWSGQTQDALDCFYKSLGFGRLGPIYVAALGGAAISFLQLGRDADALDLVEKGLKLSDSYSTYYMVKGAALTHLGQIVEAREIMAHYLAIEPDRNLKHWMATNNYGGSEGGKRYFEGLRLAELPEK